MKQLSIFKIFILITGIMTFNAGIALKAQQQVKIKTFDGLTIYGNLYETNDKNARVILLCHQARSSKNEYKQSAAQFNKLGYTCLAIDQRSGDTTGMNQTVMEAKKNDMPTSYMDAEADIIAAIEYLHRVYKKKITVLGSSYSASLIIKIAAENPDKIEKIAAFSPGEYFEDKNIINTSLSIINIPVFITGGQGEEKQLSLLTKDIVNDKIVLFKPVLGGKHGASVLNPDNRASSTYWTELSKFLK
jgi:dienelactone hydrolase